MHALLRGQESLQIVGALQQLDRLPQQVAATSAQAVLLAPTGGMGSALELLGQKTLPCWCVLLVPPATTRLYGAGLLGEQGVQCLPLTADPNRILLALRRPASSLRHGVAVETLSRGVGGRLTPREQEVVERLARGETNALIACDLRISEETVKAHLTSVYRKLGVANRAAAIATYLGAL
jgi:DNA-binding NarL/FixJ family response regulator